MMQHMSIFQKMDGFGGRILHWVYSFPTSRSHISIYNFMSELISVDSGVLQGSHCEHLLFWLFINDAARYLKHSQFLMFAHDLNLKSAV